ncbi:probable receptor-like protein kinase [Tanacetum coccineum]
MNTNLLALVATAQHYPDTYYQAPKPHKTHAPSSRHSTLTRTHATTRNKGKEIVKSPSPQSESASKEDNDEEQAKRDKQMQKSLALITKQFKNIYMPINNNLITSSNTRNKNVKTSPRKGNERQTGHWGFTVGQTVLKAASCKVTKHVKACIENQHVFVSFAFDTFGFLAPEAVELLNRVQRIVKPNSDNQQQHALLFEYASNGTLHDKLHMLSWKQRTMIAFHLATALEYIHSMHIIHGDIKASNILLDQHFNCKLCDFGSAKLGFTSMVLPPSSTKTNRMMIMGSQGYVDPHYLKTGLVSKKNDIYSYGVVLLELITGREAFSMERGDRLTQIIRKVDVEELVDPRLMKYDVFDIEEVKAMVKMAGKCIGSSPMARPSATEIVASMRDIFTHL